VNDIVGHPEHRDEIVTFVKENGGLEYSRMRLDEYVEKAVRALDVLPDSQEKAFLVELAYFTAKRDK
jgi:octaprenyl-diphosphate synthase